MRPIVTALFLAACGAAPATAPARAPLTNQSPAPGAPAATDRLPIGSGDLGGAGPVSVRAADAQERWIALCQARGDTGGNGKLEPHAGRDGDDLTLSLVLGGGPGTPIDALAGHSADGRWLAIVRGGKLELVDAQSGDVFALRGADTQSDGRPGMQHRAAVFAKDRLLFIRHTAGRDDRLVVHDPAGHGERELAVPGRLWRFNFDFDADRIADIYTVPRDQPFPALQTTLGAGDCIGPAMSFSAYSDRGPQPTGRWIDLDTGKELTDDGVAVAIGATLVRTPDDGALYLDHDQIAPPSCQPHLLAVMPRPARVIAICGHGKQARIVLAGKGLYQELASLDRDTDFYRGLSGAIVPAPGVVCDSGLHCVATATNQYIDLQGGIAEHAWGNKLYVLHATRSSRRHEIIDVATGARTPIKTADRHLAEGRFLIDDDHNLVDLDAVRILGKFPDAIQVSARGRVLQAAAQGSGPLRWTAP